MIMILLFFTHSYMYITKKKLNEILACLRVKKSSTISYYILLTNIVKSHRLSTDLLFRTMLKSKMLKAK